MTNGRDEILAVLQQQETTLLALLEAIRRAIHKIQSGEFRSPPPTIGEESRLMSHVLKALGGGGDD